MIAPLLDIMFLVLLFFILNTSSGSVESFDVDIPQASQGENRQPPNHIVVLIRANDEGFVLNEVEVNEAEFPARLQALMRELGTSQILLLASQEADYGRVMRSMDMMKRAGASSVSLGVERLEEADGQL